MNVDLTIVTANVHLALQEDVGTGDVTAGLLPAELCVQAYILSREPMLVCGQPWVDETFRAIDPKITVDWLVREGQWLNQGQKLCTIQGNARHILTAERTALNFLQILSGTASRVRSYLTQLKGSSCKLLDTRKTIPGLRYAQKYATVCAGGVNHRMGLYDAFLIKENHIRACGSIQKAIETARILHPHLFLEIEVETEEEFQQALRGQPDRILLDNFNPALIQKMVNYNQPKICELEASGGINLTNLQQFAATGVDYISIGALTKSIEAIDLSLQIEK